MKLKLRADKNDLIIFGIVSLFLLYIIAVCILNVNSLIQNGVPSGLNPIEAFFPQYISVTLGIWIAAILTLIGSSSSYFFTFEKGFGYTGEKKEDGYSRWAKDKEIKNAFGVKRVLFTETKSEYAGTPLIYDKDAAYVDNGESHTLVLGATGSGKTSGIIDPTLMMLMKGRESVIITDPKGEIYEHHYALLKKLGYQIIVLNFREPQKGNCWNPYDLPYLYQKEGNFDKANELLNDLATNIVVDGQAQDPFWQNAAADYLTGLGLALFEDAPKDEININSINLMMNQGEERYGASTYMKEYFNLKDPASSVAINLAGTVNTAAETKQGVMSVLQQKVKTLAITKNLSEMLSKSDFEMSSIGEKPTAVFLIIQDEKTTYHSLATIFVKQCYESLISVAHKHGGALPVRTNFLIDEFANMPKFKDITTMVTAARSRHIRFTFIIQNFAQLTKVYGKEDAETIRGNCGNLIYLLTGELSALEEISKLCGDKLVRVGKDKKEETRPLITVSELQRMKLNEYILIKQRCAPFKGKLRQGFDNDFGFGLGKDIFGKNVEYPQREMTEIRLFKIKDFVKKAKQEKMEKMGSPFPNKNPFMEKPKMPFSPMGGGPSNFDIDAMIKDIDRKIAELEKEEAEEKKKAENKSKIPNMEEKEDFNIIKPKFLDDIKKEEKNIKEENTVKEAVIEEKNDEKEKDIVDSKLVDFDNFIVKNDEEKEENTVREKKEEDKITNKTDSAYDDFFDDFFYED